MSSTKCETSLDKGAAERIKRRAKVLYFAAGIPPERLSPDFIRHVEIKPVWIPAYFARLSLSASHIHVFHLSMGAAKPETNANFGFYIVCPLLHANSCLPAAEEINPFAQVST